MVYALDISASTMPDFAPTKIANIGQIVNVVLPLMMLGGVAIFFIMFLMAGFRWITGGGNPEEMKKIQSQMSAAIVGIIIVVVSYVLVKLIGTMLNINIL